ncbi:MAG: phosphatase PAP2 family protein [Bacteroidia bacterium]|nr:phosphatase PAP2 family protein [Bacteroidia bacterium]
MRVFSVVFLLHWMLITVSAQNAEVRMLQKIHKDSSIFKDKSFKFISKSVLPVSIAAPSSLLLAGFINNDPLMKRNGFKSAISIALAGTLGTSLKLIIRRERPFKQYDFFRAKDKVGPFSFPSNHTTFAFATATSLSLAVPKWYVVGPAYLFAGLASYSRMYLGVHFPSDVFGGIVIGVGSAFLVWGADRLMNGK